MSRKFKVGDKVALTWLDAVSPTDRWSNIPIHPTGGRMRTRGFVVGVSKSCIAVTHTLNPDGQCISPLEIPWGCVLRVGKR